MPFVLFHRLRCYVIITLNGTQNQRILTIARVLKHNTMATFHRLRCYVLIMLSNKGGYKAMNTDKIYAEALYCKG